MSERIVMDRARGFTLLELLVAITILSLLVTASFGALRMAQRSLDAGITHGDRIEQARATSNLLRRQIAQMIFTPASETEAPPNAFVGDSSSLEFLAPAPRFTLINGVIVYRIAIEAIEDNRSEQLILSYSPFDPGDVFAREREPERRLVLTDGLSQSSFEYFGTLSDEVHASWHEHWPAAEPSMPRLVRLRLAADDQADSWPDIVFTVARGEKS